MLITQSRMNHVRKGKTLPTSQPTLHNEPHVPRDAVNRGFQQLDFSKVGRTLRGVVVGAAGGAAGGALGNGAWAIPVTMGTMAGTETVASVLETELFASPIDESMRPLFAPVTGATAGLIAGVAGYALSAFTGMSPTVSGAIAGGATGLLTPILK